MIAHGGAAGAIAELLVFVVIVALFAAVWLRERRAREEDGSGSGPAPLRDDEEPS